MKVLSLKQPFAELILSGKKTIKLRKWNTKLRGEFLIHSSKIPDRKSMERFGFGIFSRPRTKLNLDYTSTTKSLACGFILGKANLVEVKHYKDDEEFIKDKDFHLADSSFGKFGFVLKDAERINPIPARGQLNFWDLKYEIRICS